MTEAGPPRPFHLGYLGLAALALLVSTLVLYAPVAGHDFVDYDDGAYIAKNPEVLAGLTPESVRWAFTRTHSSNWHPLTWLSHMLDVELFGTDAGAHHLVNATLHAVNAALLLIALAALTRRFWPCVVVAALFAVHPLRVESVAWASERKDVLSAFFFFLALLAYAAWVRASSPRRPVLYGGVVAAMALGLLAKPMVVTLPFVLLLLDRWPLRRPDSVARLVGEKGPLFVLSLASCAMTWWAQSLGDSIQSVERLPLDVRVSNSVVAYVAYLLKTLWPSGLAVFYPHVALVDAESYSPLGPRVIASGLLLVAASVLAVLQREQRPWILVGWLWFLGMLVPVIGIVQVGAQWMADRYAYLPLIGIYLAVVWTVDGALASRARTARVVAVAAGLAVAAVLVPVTRRQIATWRNTSSLFSHALAVTDGNYVAHINLGFMEHHRGDLAAARAHYEAALAITPTMVDALSDLGGLCWQEGKLDEAEELLQRAIAVDPRFPKAWLNLGLVRRSRGDDAAALEAFRAAVRADPDSVDARGMLADELLVRGEVAEAVRTMEEAVRRRGQDPDAHFGLAKALARDGEGARALRHLERVLVRDGRSVDALEALELRAWVLATSRDARDGREALRTAQRCVARAPGAWSSLRVLAAAQAATGDFENAARTALDAATRAPAEHQDELMAMHARFRAGEALAE